MALYNRVKTLVATGGVGNLTLGAPAANFRAFGAAGVTTGTVVSYVIEDASAASWEYGRGTWTGPDPGTFARTTILATSAGGVTPINASTSSVIFIDGLAEDFAHLTTSGRMLFNNGGSVGETANVTYDGTDLVATGVKVGTAASNVKLAPNGATVSYTITLPAGLPSAAGQVLSSDLAGNLSWSASYTLPVPTATVMGGVKANAGTAGQFVTGISTTDGSLTFGSPAAVTISDTAPTAPKASDLWWRSSDGKMYIYYNDGNTSQWVAASS